jgi:NADH-quinone oxidoreductase subunit J
MNAQEIVFSLIGLGTGLTAVLTVTSKNLVHAALFLATTLAGIGATFLVMRADFLAWVQIVVYVGAVAVLFLFGLMLTSAPIGREALDSQNKRLGLAVSVAMFGVLFTLMVDAFGGLRPALDSQPRIADIGEAIFAVWVFPFEVVSLLLLAALIGAIMLSRRESGESGREDAPSMIDMGHPPSTEVEAGAEARELEATVPDSGGDQ